MLVLIAESKTMTACDRPVAAADYDGRHPAGEAVADAVMALIRETDIPQLASATRLSATMVRRLREMAYEFPNKALGSPAIEAYTGVVFKAFAYPTPYAAPTPADAYASSRRSTAGCAPTTSSKPIVSTSPRRSHPAARVSPSSSVRP